MNATASVSSGSVYRHLERRWVDEFFDTGSIQLTTLPHCREHEDSSRRDSRDGKVNFSISDGRQMMAGISTAGRESYMLCASKSCDKGLQERFGTDSWIEIVDVARFSDAVADAIACTGEALVDCCRYADLKEINRIDASLLDDHFASVAKIINDNGDIAAELEKAHAQMGRSIAEFVGDNAYFMKDRHYEIEQEVRFVWPVGHLVGHPQPFPCPDARQFCKRGP